MKLPQSFPKPIQKCFSLGWFTEPVSCTISCLHEDCWLKIPEHEEQVYSMYINQCTFVFAQRLVCLEC